MSSDTNPQNSSKNQSPRHTASSNPRNRENCDKILNRTGASAAGSANSSHSDSAAGDTTSAPGSSQGQSSRSSNAVGANSRNQDCLRNQQQ